MLLLIYLHSVVYLVPPAVDMMMLWETEREGQTEVPTVRSHIIIRVVVRRFFSLLARNLARCDVSLAIDGSVQEKSCVGAS
jgi:hypothetical protein